MIEQEMLSTVFDKKVCFHVSKLKNAGQNQSSRETFFVWHLIYFKRKTGLFSRSLFDCFNPLMASLMMISGIVDYFPNGILGE